MGRLQDAVEELYGLPIADFTARRNELAKAARADKDGEAAAAIMALKKPAVHLWLANRLARDHELAVSRLLGTARDLAGAQEKALAGAEGAGDRLRRDSAEYQRALDQAVREAGPLLTRAGHGGGEEALRRVRDVLSSAARGSADAQQQLAAGRLTEEPAAPDFGMFAAALPAGAPAAPRRVVPPAQKPRVEPDPPRRRAEDDDLATRRRERTAALRRELDEAQARLDRAEKTARRLRRRAEAVAAEARGAQSEAGAAEAAAAQAKAAVDDIRARLEETAG